MGLKTYPRVIFFGLLSIGAITGIYSYISAMESTQVRNDLYDKSGIYPMVVSGIMCYRFTGSKYTSIPSETCNNMAITMANMTASHSEWNCNTYTDYSSESLIFNENIIDFKFYFLILIVFSFTNGVFSTIHDCTLIYYKDNLQSLTFYPLSDDEDFYFSNRLNVSIIKKVTPKNRTSFLLCCTCLLPLWILKLLAILLLDIPFIFCIYPCVSSCWKIKNNKITAISYISSSWVGVSRFMMSLAAIMMTQQATNEGFSHSITALDANECFCNCQLILTEFDFYKFLFVTYIFIGLNAKFIWSWFQESIHLQDYFYLIQFTLPVKISNQINPNDCTGDVMKPSSSVVLLSSSANKEQKEQEQAEEHKTNNIKEFNMVAFKWRTVFVYLFASFCVYICSSFYFLATENYYNYSSALCIAVYIIAGVCAILWIIGVLWFCWIRLKYIKMVKNTDNMDIKNEQQENEWKVYYNNDGVPYYFNVTSGNVQWTNPMEKSLENKMSIELEVNVHDPEKV